MWPDGSLGWIGAVIGLGTLGLALVAMVRSLRRPSGSVEPGARIVLRLPLLLVATLCFVRAACGCGGRFPSLWDPDSQSCLPAVGSSCCLEDAACTCGDCARLVSMFGPASGFGVRLSAGHRLIDLGTLRPRAAPDVPGGDDRSPGQLAALPDVGNTGLRCPYAGACRACSPGRARVGSGVRSGVAGVCRACPGVAPANAA